MTNQAVPQFDDSAGNAAQSGVTIDPSGEATVQFAVRNAGTDPQAVTASALDDGKTILHTVSQSTDASRITSTTAIGTCPVVNESGTVPESIVLRASMDCGKRRRYV